MNNMKRKMMAQLMQQGEDPVLCDWINPGAECYFTEIFKEESILSFKNVNGVITALVPYDGSVRCKITTEAGEEKVISPAGLHEGHTDKHTG